MASDEDEAIMKAVERGYRQAYETQRPLATQDEMDAAWDEAEPNLRLTMLGCSSPATLA